MNTNSFLTYRYLIVPTQNMNLYNTNYSSKEDIVNNYFSELFKNCKTSWEKNNRRFILVGDKHDKELFIFKYARESYERIFIENDSDIECQDLKVSNFIFIIIDTKHQIIFIEKQNRVFSTSKYALEILRDQFNKSLEQNDYSINIYPLVSSKNFWNYVDKADNIYELTLVFNKPNLALLGNFETKKLLKEINDATDNETFEISLKSKFGTLKIVKNMIGDYIDYIREVGGRYKLKFKKNNATETKTSDSDVNKIVIYHDKTQDFTEREIASIREKSERVNTLQERDDE